MIPGTTMGVLFGDLAYTWMAFRLAKRTGSGDVTAMPLGLDTPSTIGIALTVLGPAFVAMKQAGRISRKRSHHDAANWNGHYGDDWDFKNSYGVWWKLGSENRAKSRTVGVNSGRRVSSHRIHSSCRHIWAAGSRNDLSGLVLYTLVARGSFPEDLPGN